MVPVRSVEVAYSSYGPHRAPARAAYIVVVNGELVHRHTFGPGPKHYGKPTTADRVAAERLAERIRNIGQINPEHWR